MKDVPRWNESYMEVAKITTPQKRMWCGGSSTEDEYEVEVGVEPPNLIGRRSQGNKATMIDQENPS